MRAVELPGFYKTAPWHYLDATMHYFSRKGKNGSEGNSGIVRAAIPPYT